MSAPYSVFHWLVSSALQTHVGPPVWRQGILHIPIDGPINWQLRVQRSPDLTNWHDWQKVTLGDAAVELGDPEATLQKIGFYRAVAP